MTRMVKCAKLGEQAEGLDSPPFPGNEGQKIYDRVSKQAWQEWVDMQTMIINENHLTPFEPKAKKLLEIEREKFLFGDGGEMPDGYVPPKE